MTLILLTTVLSSLRSREPEEISRLNDCIQTRFLDRKAFGMRRILPDQFHGTRTFQPENPTEQAVVGELRQKGYEVVLYLAGRKILSELNEFESTRRYRVQGPAFITQVSREEELPGQDALLDESRRALSSFQGGRGYEIRKGEWTVAMRPLRANQECVHCHAGAKPGDALGVAMYAYRLRQAR